MGLKSQSKEIEEKQKDFIKDSNIMSLVTGVIH